MAKKLEFDSAEEMADVYEVAAAIQIRLQRGETIYEALQDAKFLEDIDGRSRALVLQVLAQYE